MSDVQAVLFDRQSAWLSVSGPDRVSWLQGMVSNDVGRLGPGQGCPAAHLSPQGKIVALMTILADDDRLWILSESHSGPSLVERLDRLLIMEDASLADESGRVATRTLAGEGARTVLESVFGAVPERLYDHRVSGDVRVLRTRRGFDLIIASAKSGEVDRRLADAGAIRGDSNDWAELSIEKGIPRWGVDVDDSVTLPEIGEDAIDYEKGCYIGQEVVAKIRYIGHVNRRLRGVRVEGERVPEPGPILKDGREVGRLTSAVLSPRFEGVIGLGFLKRGADAPGTVVEISANGGAQSAVVVDLPFRITLSA